jgi:hypothetical protein
MTLPVPNTNAPLVDTRTGKIIPPWNMFFQQLVQPAPAAVDVTNLSPFTANSNGTLVITNAKVPNPLDLTTFITLIRGTVKTTIIGTNAVIPIAIGDTVLWTVDPTPPTPPALPTKVTFLGA